jgi:hypothetical protein
MWPFDLLRRLFSPGSPMPGGESDDLDDRLADFVKQERDREVGGEGARSERSGSREKIAAARQIADTIAGAFEAYARDRVLKKHGRDFQLERPADAKTRDYDVKIGDVKSGNEYRYIALTFQDRYAIIVRVQAIILSRDIQVKTLFMQLRPGTAPHHVSEVDLSAWSNLSEVKWDQVFERTFLEFLDWQRAAAAKPAP